MTGKNKNIYEFMLPNYTYVQINSCSKEQAYRILGSHLAQRDNFALISQIDFLGVKKQK
jgi:hypothetical protein|tara:strand:+ start:157 stop:333 length:177 start_codon:yes stop_codon:yes gene_type:complete